MKAFLIGMAAMVVISVGAVLVVNTGFDYSATSVFQSERGSVRLD